jgi:hypothetical protein
MNGEQNHIERRYLFHAEALGLAAHIRRPKDYFIDSVASSTLAITGGRADGRAGAGEAGIISYQSAVTHVCGDFVTPEEAVNFTHGNYGENNLHARTTVQASVTGFKIDVPQDHSDFDLFGRSNRTVSIEQLDATLGSTSDRQSPNAYRTLSATVRGVVVDGRPLEVNIDTTMFTENCTKRRLDCALDDEEFRQRSVNQILYDTPGFTLATVVTNLHFKDGAPPHTQIDKNKVTIRGLGSLYFGELVVQEGFRRLTLLRFQLGSPDGGEGTVVQADSNGQTSPPQKGGT